MPIKKLNISFPYYGFKIIITEYECAVLFSQSDIVIGHLNIEFTIGKARKTISAQNLIPAHPDNHITVSIFYMFINTGHYKMKIPVITASYDLGLFCQIRNLTNQIVIRIP